MTGRIDLDLPEAAYHAHPALSSTQARKLLDSPARYQWDRDHPQAPKKEFDLGTAVHSKVLGVGAPTVAIPDELLASNGAASTRAVKEWIEQQRAAGNTPVKQSVAEQVRAMTESVLAHPIARALFEQPGNAEASVFATDPDTSVDMRARFDYLPDFTAEHPVAVDLKTTAKSAAPDAFSRVVADHGYYVQQEWYLHAWGLATGDFTAQMEFVVVETEPPYLVNAYPLASEFAEIGQAKVRQALAIYAACDAAGEFPGYPINPDPLQPPTWLMFQEGAIA
ncbi:PD-(D/E)XK nuclease-like domain-containing protein [Curtobacterium sp. MCLR17_036]|uniref:PD-(D/E)XK nuclease-like domain-containing protein n=1 Tax=Curtobacterium sp. MCLR17_036 TaxID=2175620 RepID=UPI000DA7D5C8|nr:PD-(D/E)XK nuclease-like domain-containing protein [Curtobacterium sp. MCLR17_036]WIE65922.1 PD-(D/E)XK nuclease-like domain-containing protein [Curtobacterium sp. MCLR17_036]